MNKYMKEFLSVDDKDGFQLLMYFVHKMHNNTASKIFNELEKKYGHPSKILTKNRRIMVKYFEVFLESTDIESFVKIGNKKYPKMGKLSMPRYYAYYRKHIGIEEPVTEEPKVIKVEPVIEEQPKPIIKKPKKQKYYPAQKSKPTTLKLLELKDMVNYKYKLTREFLSRHGFQESEINWLIDEGWEIDEQM